MSDLDRVLSDHLAPLTAYLRSRLGPELRAKESVSDLVQSTCREILAHSGRFGGDADTRSEEFRRWLFTTAERKVKDKARFWRAERRAGGKEEPLVGEDAVNGAVLRQYERFCTPSHDAAVADELARVERALDALPEDHRRVILLHHVVGLGHARIAEEIGRTEAATRQLLSRALAKLARLL